MTDHDTIQIAHAYLRMGLRAQARGELTQAIEFFTLSIAALATPEAYTYRGIARSQMGHFDAAIRECERALELDPERGMPHHDMGVYHMHQHRYDEGEACFQHALDAPADDVHALTLYNLSRLYVMQGKFNDAVDAAAAALAEDPNMHDAEALLLRLRQQMN